MVQKDGINQHSKKSWVAFKQKKSNAMFEIKEEKKK